MKNELSRYNEIGISTPLIDLMEEASGLRDQEKFLITYSKKVFIPLTMLCRDVCHYCTFAKVPRKLSSPFLRPDQVLKIAKTGEKHYCKEALFTLGEKPELRYKAAREDLKYLGYDTTLDYLHAMAKMVLDETGLLPHLNPGTMSMDEIKHLKEVSLSMGIMLESASKRLCQKGGPHYGSPDKDPELRLQTIQNLGELNVPVTTGILIGIGETREERLESLLAIKQLHEKYEHVQEIIIQNFIPKPDTKMKNVKAPEPVELLWTLSMARIIFGPTMNIQCPPNLNKGLLSGIIDSGINDWGGVSPVTNDHVNPESPWPDLELLKLSTNNKGFELQERLAVYPEYQKDPKWVDSNLKPHLLELSDSEGYGRHNKWRCGESLKVPKTGKHPIWTDHEPSGSVEISNIISKSFTQKDLSHSEITSLFKARGNDFHLILNKANELRQIINAEEVSYVVTRNINYTNICKYTCHFCAFSKGKTKENLRGKPYLLSFEEIGNRALEAWNRGATEVCMQGGIHPHFDGETYLNICNAITTKVPDMHIHAFSPLEITHGATSLGISIENFLIMLKESGLKTMPGTAAEILDDDVRKNICPDKLNSNQWLEVIKTAHHVGIKTTSTIMFGHQEHIEHWSTHLIKLRELQKETGGITEFIPLPFVSMESPMYKRGNARPGPTFREVLLMHAVARLALHPYIQNIQSSWVKLGSSGAESCLHAGVNDMGGTLMNESISKAAGSIHGQEFEPLKMETFIKGLGRKPVLRDTLYNDISNEKTINKVDSEALDQMQFFLDSAHPIY